MSPKSLIGCLFLVVPPHGALALVAAPAAQQHEPSSSDTDEKGAAAEPAEEDEKGSKPTLRYDRGTELTSGNGSFRAHVEWRAQLRFADTEEAGSPDPEDVIEEGRGFEIRRARFKLGGHTYRPWLQYYLEYELVRGGRLLDLRFTIQPRETIGVRVGQYKALYNRERLDSSGKQQFAERSIVTSPFTIDRQPGLTLLGHLFAGTPGDSRYAVGVFTGTGRDGDLDDDGRPMVTARWQWNFLGRDVPFTQSDIGRTEQAIASFSVAAASNRSRFTRFSSSGGGQLRGFEEGASGQYDVEQAMGEVALMSRGLSMQGEYHWKRIDDRIERTTTELTGWFAQIGYFLSEVWSAFPEPLELAVRFADVSPREGSEEPGVQELTVAANWFFDGHRNKLTFDVGDLDADDGAEGLRLRLQWDVSF